MKGEHTQFSECRPGGVRRLPWADVVPDTRRRSGRAFTGPEERFGFGIGLRHRHLNPLSKLNSQPTQGNVLKLTRLASIRRCTITIVPFSHRASHLPRDVFVL